MPEETISYPLTPQTLPVGTCWSTNQQLLNIIAANLFVTIPVSNGFLITSATRPDTQFEGIASWHRLDSSGNPIRIYWFSQGAWLSKHPQLPGFVMPWFDTVPTFSTFDGGDALPLSTISGPMWEKIATIDGRFPLTTGTLPSGTIVAQGDTGGEEKHELLITEIPSHTHDLIRPRRSTTGEPSWESGDGADFTATTEPTGGDAEGDTVPHNNMPPYVGMCWLRRTIREFYTV